MPPLPFLRLILAERNEFYPFFSLHVLNIKKHKTSKDKKVENIHYLLRTALGWLKLYKKEYPNYCWRRIGSWMVSDHLFACLPNIVSSPFLPYCRYNIMCRKHCLPLLKCNIFPRRSLFNTGSLILPPKQSGFLFLAEHRCPKCLTRGCEIIWVTCTQEMAVHCVCNPGPFVNVIKY